MANRSLPTNEIATPLMADFSNQWTLWRQDDNGSRSVIATQLEREDAKSRLAELEARGHKQHYWIEQDDAAGSTRPTLPFLNLVVIRARDIQVAKTFYELIGLQFELHRHGNGPEHFACEWESRVFEIYPTQESSAETRIGFAVDAVDSITRSLRDAGHEILSEPRDSPWGRRAVVRDPDGHCVELTSKLQ